VLGDTHACVAHDHHDQYAIMFMLGNHSTHTCFSLAVDAGIRLHLPLCVSLLMCKVWKDMGMSCLQMHPHLNGGKEVRGARERRGGGIVDVPTAHAAAWLNEQGEIVAGRDA
jgi:hypothetical protein